MTKEGSPRGTWESNTTSPTFDHFPMGSRLTPLLIRACETNTQVDTRHELGNSHISHTAF